jgi:hypothetical protein
MTIKQMQREIARLTQRACVSTDHAYLTQRLASLRRREDSGARLPNTPRADASAVVGVSLTRRRRDLLGRISSDKKRTVSSIMRDAFDLWCFHNGHRAAINAIVDDERREREALP